MWAETKHGLYKKFVFEDFDTAWQFMQRAAQTMQEQSHHARWQNEWNVVEFWLSTHASGNMVTDKDMILSRAIDAVAEGQNLAEKHDDKVTTNHAKIQMYADGGSRGNPGHSASGFVLLDQEGNVLHEQGIYLGITTNNQAEYMALKFGLEAARSELHARRVDVFMDSLLVVNQMKKIFKVRNKDLWPVHDAIVKLVAEFDEVTFTHVPRELNKLADAQVNMCLDAELYKDVA